MYCKTCGTALPPQATFCNACGSPVTGLPAGGGVGYSPRIHDPAFAHYLKNANRFAGLFASFLAVAAVVGFTIAGEFQVDGISNPTGFYLGLGIGGMFLLIGLLTTLGRKSSHTWDGVVVNKTIQNRTRQVQSGDEYDTRHYVEYTVFIQQTGGKLHQLIVEDDDTIYRYYEVGDHVRHHAGLNSYEKYDKSADRVIFCNACATLCDIELEHCPRCGCPLLK